jgi:succinate dehydrogenase / fumarate reductase cytochrome b subunit
MSHAMLQARPRSPHIQIYRPQLTSVLSITHRVTGVLLSAASLVVAVWLIAGSLGAGPYDAVLAVLRSWIGMAFLFVWTFCTFFHLCNGIRHLFWDAGYGFELRSIYLSGWSVIATSAALTIVTWLAGYRMSGGAW